MTHPTVPLTYRPDALTPYGRSQHFIISSPQLPSAAAQSLPRTFTTPTALICGKNSKFWMQQFSWQFLLQYFFKKFNSLNIFQKCSSNSFWNYIALVWKLFCNCSAYVLLTFCYILPFWDCLASKCCEIVLLLFCKLILQLLYNWFANISKLF